jgi:hypothetical protein
MRLSEEQRLMRESCRAFVDDVQVSSWRGLTGSYPSRLFLLPLDQVVDEYTKVELRGLQSVPLRLERAEIEALLARAAQVHWSYDGRYWFVTNNCAVETWKLLNDGVPRLSQAPLRSITPSGLLRKLQRQGIADASVLAERERAIREGHYFESQAEHYGALFEVADVALGLPRSRVEDWLALDPAQRVLAPGVAAAREAHVPDRAAGARERHQAPGTARGDPLERREPVHSVRVPEQYDRALRARVAVDTRRREALGLGHEAPVLVEPAAVLVRLPRLRT